MPENETPVVEETVEATESAPAFEAITSQEELDKILGQRLARQKAQYAGYAEYKAKAEKYDEFEQSQKTELERAQEALKAAEARASAAEQASLRSEVAREKGVPSASLIGATREELEASADQLIAWRDAAKPAAAPKTPTATSGTGLKSGASGADHQPMSDKERAADAIRRLRAGI